jgi:hypothetical protein
VAGMAAAIMLLTRPALAPAALALAAIPIACGGTSRWRCALLHLIPVSAAIALQGWLQWYLYGDVFGSGYGGIADLFSRQTAAGNLRSYLHWGYLTLGPIWLGALAIGMAVPDGQTRRVTHLPAVVLMLIGGAVGLPYLFYRPYDHWETLRFLLPIIAVATIVASAGLIVVARRVAGRTWGATLAGVIAVFIAWTWVSWLGANHVFMMPASEARHRYAGDLVAQVTASNAVIMALQHSGSLRYYGNRQTVNWDVIPSGGLPASTRALQMHGHDVYVMIDSQAEREVFEARHGTVLDHWLPSGQRGNIQLFQAPPTN